MINAQEKLHNFLTDLPKREYGDFQREVDFMAEAVPKFYQFLGYSDSEVFFGVHSRNLRPDVILASERNEKPWILIEVKILRRHRLPDKGAWRAQLLRYLSEFHPKPKYAVLFSPVLLIIYHDNSEKEYDLDSLTLEESQEIYTLLRKPGRLPKEPKLAFKEPHGESINTDTYKLDLRAYSKKLESVKSAKTNNEKKKSLENLARFLFEGIPFIVCKYSNLRTASSEIDHVMQYDGWNKKTIFDEFGCYILVECKNWNCSVGASQVRDFVQKMQKSKVSLGVIFARNGISGAHSGVDALREIHSVFDRHDLFLIIISIEDLDYVLEGNSFYDIMDKKIDELRFDL